MGKKGLKMYEKRQKREFLDLENPFLAEFSLMENHPTQKPLAEMGGTPPPLAVSLLSFSGTPSPLNGKSFCPKTCSGNGGYPPPLTDKIHQVVLTASLKHQVTIESLIILDFVRQAQGGTGLHCKGRQQLWADNSEVRWSKKTKRHGHCPLDRWVVVVVVYGHGHVKVKKQANKRIPKSQRAEKCEEEDPFDYVDVRPCDWHWYLWRNKQA